MTLYKMEDFLNLDDSKFNEVVDTELYPNSQDFTSGGFGNPSVGVPAIIADVPKLSRLSELSLLPQYNSNSSNRIEKKSVQKHKKDRVLKSFVKAIDKTLETSDSSILSSTPSPKSIFSYGFSSSLDDERPLSMVEEHLLLPQDDAYINENVSIFKLALEKSPVSSPREQAQTERNVFSIPNVSYGFDFSTMPDTHNRQLLQSQQLQHNTPQELDWQPVFQQQHQQQQLQQNQLHLQQEEDGQNLRNLHHSHQLQLQLLLLFQEEDQNQQYQQHNSHAEISPILTAPMIMFTPAKPQMFGYMADLENSLEFASMSFEEQFDIHTRIQFQSQNAPDQLRQVQKKEEEAEEEEGDEQEEDDEEDELYTDDLQSSEQTIAQSNSMQPIFQRLHEVRADNHHISLTSMPLMPEKKRRKLSIQPLTYDQIRLTQGLLRKTMIRHYDTEDLKIQIKKEIAKEQKALKDALKRPGKTASPKKRTISKTRLQTVSVDFTQVLTGLHDLEVVFSNNHILSSSYWSAKGDNSGVTEMRNIVSVLRHQYKNRITFEFIDDDLNPHSIVDGVKLLKFSVISRLCEHLEGDNYVTGWVHLITYNDLSELLGFSLDISDEMIVVNDDSLIFETQNEPWKRLLMRWRSIYDKKLFIISESKEMMQLKIEKAKSRGRPFKLDEREKKLKEDLFNQLMSYKGLLGAPSKTAKDQALIKTNKLESLIKVVLEKYCWIDPSTVPPGGYRRLF
ncbi:HDL127Wp [Eremothecium sinecaudum]|uniref:HDL127Wp n=1 Tax=Eremothecium sinecaudum TaxID=45286 RepID=A0A0X8HSC6_9SACH|nr:HDL127Wp [Eremothecium sinecaudum]AMD20617.1 HDL127Wp [Eremothecium sinecaudum]